MASSEWNIPFGGGIYNQNRLAFEASKVIRLPFL